MKLFAEGVPKVIGHFRAHAFFSNMRCVSLQINRKQYAVTLNNLEAVENLIA